MIKKLIIIFVAAFVTLTVVVAVLSARKGDQRRLPTPAVPTTRTLHLDMSPLRSS
ncbi:MAG TPA: hypothetical protein VMP11_18650 [Verrucomicrobiae bacterium]|nr:hypothetical protein [Verrucomicrobiae bacterium]